MLRTAARAKEEIQAMKEEKERIQKENTEIKSKEEEMQQAISQMQEVLEDKIFTIIELKTELEVMRMLVPDEGEIQGIGEQVDS